MAVSVDVDAPADGAAWIERLVRGVVGEPALADFCRDLGLLLPAEWTAILVASPSGEMASVAEFGPVPPALCALTVAEVEQLLSRDGQAQGVAWIPLRVEERLLGLLGIGAGAGLAPGQVAAVEPIAKLVARCVDQRAVIDGFRSADALKTEFVRTVSHELRTPLTTVIGYADLLVEEAFGPLQEDQRRALRRVGDRARGLLEVIAATLDLPGVAGGRVALERRQVSLVDILRELEADANDWRLRRDLEYRWEVPDELPVVVTDAGKVRVILKNLIANAVKFTDSGGITVRAVGREGGVEISVEDTGIGIEADAVHYVFDAFKQAGGASNRSASGVGLGLYIVRRLVGMLDGRLRVESELGVGTKFHVWFPCAALEQGD